MEGDFLDEESFFFPTPELTRSLFAAVAAARRHDQIRASEDREQAEDVEGDYINDLPPDEAAWLSSASPPAVATEAEELYVQRRFIAEELYYHLAFLCRSPPARRGQLLSMRQSVAQGVGDILGLMQDEPLLKQLEDEFNDWLSRSGQFPAGWGKIILAEGRQFYLVELSSVESGEFRRLWRAVGGGQESD